MFLANRIFCSPEYFGHQNTLATRIFCPQEYFAHQNILFSRIFWPPEYFAWQNILVTRIFRTPEFFWSSFGHQNYFGHLNILAIHSIYFCTQQIEKVQTPINILYGFNSVAQCARPRRKTTMGVENCVSDLLDCNPRHFCHKVDVTSLWGSCKMAGGPTAPKVVFHVKSSREDRLGPDLFRLQLPHLLPHHDGLLGDLHSGPRHPQRPREPLQEQKAHLKTHMQGYID